MHLAKKVEHLHTETTIRWCKELKTNTASLHAPQDSTLPGPHGSTTYRATRSPPKASPLLQRGCSKPHRNTGGWAAAPSLSLPSPATPHQVTGAEHKAMPCWLTGQGDAGLSAGICNPLVGQCKAAWKTHCLIISHEHRQDEKASHSLFL